MLTANGNKKIVRPTILYGREVMTLYGKNVDRINSIEIRILQKTGGKARRNHARNEV